MPNARHQRSDEAGSQAHRDRPEVHRNSRQGGPLAAHTSWLRRGPRTRLAECDHLRGSVRPGLLRRLVRGLRQVGRARRTVHARVGGASHLAGSRTDPRERAYVRHTEAREHPVGRGVGPIGQIGRGRNTRSRSAAGRHRQPRLSGRKCDDRARQRLRDRRRDGSQRVAARGAEGQADRLRPLQANNLAGLWADCRAHQGGLGQSSHRGVDVEAHPPSVFKAIVTGDPYPVKALLVSATDPINSYGETAQVMEALRAVDFLVTCDYWMTPTAMLSDYVLPIAGALERPTIHSNYGVSDYLIASQDRAIQPMYERRTDYTFWRDLSIRTAADCECGRGRKREKAFYYKIYPLGYPITTYDEFVEYYRVYFPEPEYYKYGEIGFATQSGKVELYSSLLEELGYPPMPTYVSPAENEVDDPELAEKYPLVLTTGGGVMPYHHSEHFQIKELRFLRHAPYMDINPKTAAELGIKEDDWVWIETKRGRIKMKANLTQAIDPRVVVTPRGWWYPERSASEPELGGCLESNTNVLTSTADEHCDPMGGGSTAGCSAGSTRSKAPTRMQEDADGTVRNRSRHATLHRLSLVHGGLPHA